MQEKQGLIQMRNFFSHAVAALIGGVVVWAIEADFYRVSSSNEPLEFLGTLEHDDGFSMNGAIPSVSAYSGELEAETTLAKELNSLLDASSRDTGEPFAGPEDIRAALLHIVMDLPGGYTWKGGTTGSIIEVFESEARDNLWATRVENELVPAVNSGITQEGLQVAGQQIECRTYVCRVTLTHGRSAGSWDELKGQADSATDIARQVVSANTELSGAAIEHRGGYPGELTKSELLFFRTGTGVTNLTPARLDTPLEPRLQEGISNALRLTPP